MYFNIVLMLRAVSRLGPYLEAYDYCSTGTHEDDYLTQEKVSRVVNFAKRVGQFDEGILFRGENANVCVVIFSFNIPFRLIYLDIEGRIQNAL
jgi:ERO1-like protein beta